MTAASYQSYAATTAAAGVLSVVVDKPTGTVAGDLLLATLSDGGTGTAFTASGWSDPAATNMGVKVFYLVAGASEPTSYTFTRTGTTGVFVAQIVRVSGADTATPVASVVCRSTGVTSVNPPGSSGATTATSGDSLLFESFNMHDATAGRSATPPAGVTERYDATTTGTTRYVFGGDRVVSAGTPSADSWGWSGGAQQWRSATWVINPAVAAVPSGGLDATLPTLAANVSGTVEPFGPLDATLPTIEAAGSGGPAGGPIFGDITSALPALSAAGDGTSQEFDGGVGFAEELPDDDLPPADIPDPSRILRTAAFSVPPIELDDRGQPTAAWKAGAQRFEGTWGAYRLLVGGVDVTMFRDLPFQMGVREYKSPFRYQALEVTIPGVTPWTWFDRATDPDVSSWLGNWKTSTVVLQLVDEAGVTQPLWRGFIAAPNPSPSGLHLTCAGEARGRLEMDYKTIRPFMFRKDIGVCAYDLARRPGLRITPNLGVATGIPIDERTRTSGTLLDCLSELISLSENSNGDTLTFTPTGVNGNVYEMHYQDNETVDYTVFYGAHGVDASDLQDNITDHPTTLHGYGRESDGGFWANIKAPKMFEGSPPPYPGTTLSMGDAGEDVNLLKDRLQGLYLNRQDAHDEVGFGAATEDAVKDLQEDMGHAQTGVVDEATWNAAWDIGTTGTSLSNAHSEPLAQLNSTKRFNVSATGAILGANPDYDPRRPKVTEITDYGVYPKSQARKRAQRRRERLAQMKSYSGTLRLETDLFVGDYHHGDPDPVIESRFAPLDGKNIMLRGFEGDLLLHVAGDTKDERGATLPASSMALPGLEIRQKVERNMEGRGNPGLTWRRTHRGMDIPGPIDYWSEIGGVIPVDQLVQGDRWNVIDPVVVGDMGTLAQVALELADAVEFACALFAVPLTTAEANDWLPNPFADGKPWKSVAIRNLAKVRGILLEAWGDKDQPCGYGDGVKTDGDPLDGTFVDAAGLPYRTFARDDINNGKRCALYWAIWPKSDTVVKKGRSLYPNPEVGM